MAGRSGATTILYNISPAFQKIIGKSVETRPKALKAFWAYAKENKLQDPSDGRIINPDTTISAAFNTTDPIKFNQVMKLISPHLTKKSD